MKLLQLRRRCQVCCALIGEYNEYSRYPDYPSVAQFSLSALKTLRPYLDADDQDRLHAKSVESLRVAVRRGDQRCIEYWSGKPVLDVTLAPHVLETPPRLQRLIVVFRLPTIRLPIEKPLGMLSSKDNSVPLLLQGGTDPFLYNPRRAQAGKVSTTASQLCGRCLPFDRQHPWWFKTSLWSSSSL